MPKRRLTLNGLHGVVSPEVEMFKLFFLFNKLVSLAGYNWTSFNFDIVPLASSNLKEELSC
jgi:hypothetical protein